MKWKFILAFTLIPMVALGLFFSIVYSNFKSDRLASIYETSLTQSRLLSKLTSEKLSPLLSYMENWAQFYYRDPTYSEALIRAMREGSGSLRSMSSAAIVEYDPLLNKINYSSKISWAPESIDLEVFTQQIQTYSLRLLKTPKPIIVPEGLHPSDWTLIQRFKKDKDRELYVLTSISPRWTQGRYAGQVITNNFWVDEQGQLLAKNSRLPDEILLPMLRTIKQGRSKFGAFEFKHKGTEYIVAHSVAPQTEVLILSVLRTSLAYEALGILLEQSLLLLGLFLSFAILLGLFVSRHLTGALQTLLKATQALGKGIFDIRLNIQTGDEVEALSHGVKKMAKSIQTLIEETKDLARMESELTLAKEVQSTLFPPEEFESGPFQLQGYSQSASECGGDWWTYYETESDLFVIVGDATGHGVPAALLTSATNSLAALLFTMKIHSPREMLAYMNNALHETARGKKSMTMSLIKINKTTGEVHYANASHESPLLLRDLTPQTRLNQLISLDSSKSQPLGFLPNSQYEEGHIQLKPDDTILLYTDGAVDGRNRENQTWGERKFAKAAIDGLLNDPSLGGSMKQMVSAFQAHTNGQPLVDDVTLILVRYKGTG